MMITYPPIPEPPVDPPEVLSEEEEAEALAALDEHEDRLFEEYRERRLFEREEW